ncbi:MAG TPA: NYN domain-containing protein [Mycobacteriales bacterium]|nr:NYN domain-containing protein [Mycobacteriales bacterium]
MALPEPVRGRVVALAATALGGLAPEEVPAPLRKVARFTPAKRARLGGADLLAVVEGDPAFRQRVVETARAADADAVVLAYLEQAPGWQDQVREVAEQHEQERGARREQEGVARLTEQLEVVRAAHRAELEQARAESLQAKDELTAVRRKVRDLGSRLGRAEQGQADAEAALARAHAERDAAVAARDTEVRRVADRLADAERALADARQAGREGVKGDQLRLRLLLDAVVGAAQGLRRELALPPAQGRPADALAAEYAPPAAGPAEQGRAVDDPARLDALLAVPTTHLLVDGYNVTKGGYGGLTLEAQRTRLLAGLGGLAARTGAEVTVVFDGAEGTMVTALKAPRGVRMLFSRGGETADEVLRRLARHEPVGRPVVVVSSDREVADGVTDAGATAVPSLALLRLLERSVGGAS